MSNRQFSMATHAVYENSDSGKELVIGSFAVCKTYLFKVRGNKTFPLAKIGRVKITMDRKGSQHYEN